MVDRRWQHPAAGTPVGHGFVQIYEQFELLVARVSATENRVSAIEARLYAAPIVVDETAYFPDADLRVGEPVRTMQAANLPTGWVILYETRDGLPTTGYWNIDAKGLVTPTDAGVAGTKKFNNIEIIVQASNEFGTGDGKLDLKLN